MCPLAFFLKKAGRHIDRNVQILDEFDYVLHSTKTLEKAVSLIILPPAMG